MTKEEKIQNAKTILSILASSDVPGAPSRDVVASHAYRLLDPEIKFNDEVICHLFDLCHSLYSDKLWASFLITEEDFKIFSNSDMNLLFDRLTSDHYRVRFFYDSSFFLEDTIGSCGNYENWPEQAFYQLGDKHEVVFYLTESTRSKAFSKLQVQLPFYVKLTEKKLKDPSLVMKEIVPSNDLKAMSAWYDRQFNIRKGDYHLNESVHRINWLLNSLMSLAPSKVAEIGIWGGDFTWNFDRKNFNRLGTSFDTDIFTDIEKIYCVDLCQSSLDNARKRCPGDRFEFKLGFCENIPLPDNSVDVAIAAEVLEHVTDFEKSLSELKRITRDGGTVLITLPNFTVGNAGHLRIADPNIFLKDEIHSTSFYETGDAFDSGWLTQWSIVK